MFGNFSGLSVATVDYCQIDGELRITYKAVTARTSQSYVKIRDR